MATRTDHTSRDEKQSSRPSPTIGCCTKDFNILFHIVYLKTNMFLYLFAHFGNTA